MRARYRARSRRTNNFLPLRTTLPIIPINAPIPNRQRRLRARRPWGRFRRLLHALRRRARRVLDEGRVVHVDVCYLDLDEALGVVACWAEAFAEELGDDLDELRV